MVAKQSRGRNGLRGAKRSHKGYNISSLVLSLFFLLIAGGIISALVVQNLRMSDKRSDLSVTMATMDDRVMRLQERTQELEMGIERSEREEFQETILRERGLYKKEGEKVVTIVPEEQSAIDEEEEEADSRWWNPMDW